MICLAELGALSLWFSATAVIPALNTGWMSPSRPGVALHGRHPRIRGRHRHQRGLHPGRLGRGARALLRRDLGAALANAALLVWIDVFAVVMVCRFLTGLMLAGAYPPGMKLAASWFVAERGFAVAVWWAR